MSKHIHIISFDIPYPANYGGVIDVYYKLVALHKLGVKIHLHCFEYGREHSAELNKICHEVNYYKRKTGLISNLSTVPYIIQTRISEELNTKLREDSYPILCEGMHTCGILNDSLIENRKIIYRAANVEHDYYKALAKEESNAIKKAYFVAESMKLKKWESNLAKVNLILTISKNDQEYYQQVFPKIKTINTFSFFNSGENISPNFDDKSKYILFHGNLSVSENIIAAKHILKNIAPKSKHKFIIAGLNPVEEIIQLGNKLQNVKIKANLSEEDMQQLLNKAHITLLLTNQNTGLKLKLLNSLFQSKHCIANDKMLSGSNLEQCVNIANTDEEILGKINELMDTEFTASDYQNRLNKIPKEYDNIEMMRIVVGEVF